MRIALLFLMLSLTLPSVTSMAGDTLRCGTRLIQKDSLAIQVRERCGPPLSQEVIGYTLLGTRYANSVRQREFRIEQWLYGPERGYYNEIIFEGGRVKEINKIKR